MLASSSNRIDAMTKIENRNQVEEFKPQAPAGFTDLDVHRHCRATKLKNDLGDPKAIALIQEHHALVRTLLAQFRESKEIEDRRRTFSARSATPSDAVTFLADFASPDFVNWPAWVRPACRPDRHSPRGSDGGGAMR